jgi:D-ornithine/D-lysine decarboxylase
MEQGFISSTDSIDRINAFNSIRKRILSSDKRFSSRDGHLTFEDVDLYNLGKKHSTPFYVFSECEILRNIEEIKNAFRIYPNTRIFYACKTCSLIKILKLVKEAGLCVETNSVYEIMKCIEAGFSGEEIIFNGVVKKESELQYAIENNIYLINVDSFFELDLIDKISSRLKTTANICIRIEPNVPSPVHPGSMTAYHAKAGIDLKDAEAMCRKAINMPYVKLKGLHMHVGDQVPSAEPFKRAAKIIVQEAARLEKNLGIHFEIINAGGGIPVPYKYEKGDAVKDYMYGGINSEDFAFAIVEEVSKWRKDITICIEPGRKVVSSAAVLLSSVYCSKNKTNYDEAFNILDTVTWQLIDAGYSVLSDSLHFDWFFYVFSAGNVAEDHTEQYKLAGPLCDGGDYFHQGICGEYFLLPKTTAPGDVLAFLDTGAYSIESQTVYNSRPRTAVFLITTEGKVELIRREESFEDLISCENYQ